MNIEYEATFKDINKDDLRSKLSSIGAGLEREEFIQKRKVFRMPSKTGKDGFARVRDEGDKITMTVKYFDGEGIERQKENEVVVDNFDEACSIFESLGLVLKAYQETKREIWKKGEVEIMIDEWPFLEPFVEIESCSESNVKKISEELGFDWKDAIFDAVSIQYKEKYGIEESVINNETPKIIFDMENPFER